MFKAVSHEATKVSLVYSKPPPPARAECESLIKSVEKSILALLHVYSNLPKAEGTLISDNQIRPDWEKIAVCRLISLHNLRRDFEIIANSYVQMKLLCIILLDKNNKNNTYKTSEHEFKSPRNSLV